MSTRSVAITYDQEPGWSNRRASRGEPQAAARPQTAASPPAPDDGTDPPAPADAVLAKAKPKRTRTKKAR